MAVRKTVRKPKIRARQERLSFRPIEPRTFAYMDAHDEFEVPPIPSDLSEGLSFSISSRLDSDAAAFEVGGRA